MFRNKKELVFDQAAVKKHSSLHDEKKTSVCDSANMSDVFEEASNC